MKKHCHHTAFTSSILVETPRTISRLSPEVSGQGYNDALNLNQAKQF